MSEQPERIFFFDIVPDQHRRFSPIASCSHPELLESMAPLPECGMLYQCLACKKKIIIPSRTIIEPVKAEEVNKMIAGILGLAFGEQWQQKLKREL